MKTLYVVQWGKEKSICWVYEKRNISNGQFFILTNEKLLEFDELELVIN